MFLLTTLLISVHRSLGACTFPSDLTGQWISLNYGTLTFTSSGFSGFTSAISSGPLTFECDLSSGSRYLSKSSFALFGSSIDVYLCMDLTAHSTVKYSFTLNSNLDSSLGVRFYSPETPGSSVTLNEACTFTDYRSPGEYELLIKKGNITDAVTACPVELRSTFDVTMTTSSVSNCAGTRLVGSSADLNFNYSSCVTDSLSSVGYLQCLHSKTSTYTYVTLYDNDTSSPYTYTCMVYEKIGATLRATEFPRSCLHNQTHTTVNSPGVTYVMTDLHYVADEGTDNTVLIVVLCVVLGSILIAAIAVLVYCKVFRKPKPPEAAKAKKLRRKSSVIDYTPRSLGRSMTSEKDKGILSKQSTGEILTGILHDKKNKAVTLNGDAYEPPKKEAWQKKWENAESLKRSKQSFPSDGGTMNGLSALELHKSNIVSTSLPEKLDSKQAQKHGDHSGNTQAPQKYTEKSYAVQFMPKSTGKFGGSPTIKSFDSIPVSSVEPKLDTISENPFSRENTTTSLTNKSKPFKDVSKSPRIQGGDVSSVSTVAVSTGAASVGDISFQPSFQNSSRISHVSASNASIFDDPGWLLDSKKHADETFERIHNLEASIPKPFVKDPKWFLKVPKPEQVSREDIDYFRNRNNSYVGLNSKLNQGKKWTSLEIIARELKKRNENKNKKTKTVKPKLIRPKPHTVDV